MWNTFILRISNSHTLSLLFYIHSYTCILIPYSSQYLFSNFSAVRVLCVEVAIIQRGIYEDNQSRSCQCSIPFFSFFVFRKPYNKTVFWIFILNLNAVRITESISPPVNLIRIMKIEVPWTYDWRDSTYVRYQSSEKLIPEGKTIFKSCQTPFTTRLGSRQLFHWTINPHFAVDRDIHSPGHLSRRCKF